MTFNKMIMTQDEQIAELNELHALNVHEVIRINRAITDKKITEAKGRKQIEDLYMANKLIQRQITNIRTKQDG